MIILIILCITGLELYALHQHIDGRTLSVTIGILMTIAGWQAKKQQIRKRQNKLRRYLK